MRRRLRKTHSISYKPDRKTDRGDCRQDRCVGESAALETHAEAEHRNEWVDIDNDIELSERGRLQCCFRVDVDVAETDQEFQEEFLFVAEVF